MNKIYEIKLKSISKHHIASRLLNESAVRKGSDELNPVSMMHDIEQNMKQLNTAHSDEEDGEGRRKKGTDQTRKIGNVVPPEIYNTFPNINKMAYLKLQRDISFQEGVVPVCEECYLYLTSLNEASGSERLKKYFILKDNLELEGTGRLKPESLKLRSEDTRLRIKDDEIARFNRERLIKQLEENEQKVKRFLESKGRGMASFRQWQPNATDAFLRAADHHTSSQQATDRKAALFKRALPRVEKSPHKTDRTEGSTRYSSTVLQMAGPRTGIADRIFSKLGQEEASTERTCHSPRTEGFASLRKAISSQQIVGFRDRQGIDSKRASIPSKAENKGPASTHRTVHAEKSIGRSGDRFGMYSTSHSFFKPQKAAPAS